MRKMPLIWVFVFAFRMLISCSLGSNIEGLRVHDGSETIVVPEGMALIKGGTFFMGTIFTAEEPYLNESPRHEVTLSSFFMGKYQVTQEQYGEVMGTNPSYYDGADLPVERVSWYDAVEFCNKLSVIEGLNPYYEIYTGTIDEYNTNQDDALKWKVTRNTSANGYRLPTEAEWEYACRAGTVTKYNTGDSISTNEANFDGENPVPVGSFEPNAWDLYDMHGNVGEWCWDWYGNYSVYSQTNPPGTSSGAYRIVRGGSCFFPAESIRSACRNNFQPYSGAIDLGIRLVRSVNP